MLLNRSIWYPLRAVITTPIILSGCAGLSLWVSLNSGWKHLLFFLALALGLPVSDYSMIDGWPPLWVTSLWTIVVRPVRALLPTALGEQAAQFRALNRLLLTSTPRFMVGALLTMSRLMWLVRLTKLLEHGQRDACIEPVPT